MLTLVALVALVLSALSASATSCLEPSRFVVEGDKVFFVNPRSHTPKLEIDGVRAKKFRVLKAPQRKQSSWGDCPDSDLYGTDGEKVYCENKILEGADTKTFKVIKHGSGQDKTHRFKGCSRMNGA